MADALRTFPFLYRFSTRPLGQFGLAGHAHIRLIELILGPILTVISTAVYFLEWCNQPHYWGFQILDQI